MYKQTKGTIKSELKGLYTEKLFYSCNCEVHCTNGNFEKGSLVKLCSELVQNEYSDIPEEYIRVYDMDVNLGKSFPSVHTDKEYSDIPSGVTASNIETVFKEEKELTDELMTAEANRLRMINISDKLSLADAIATMTAVALLGIMLIVFISRILFVDGASAREFLWCLMSLPLFLAGVGLRVFSKNMSFKADELFSSTVKSAYAKWKNELAAKIEDEI